jgi:MSHA biogenesis protein MshM
MPSPLTGLSKAFGNTSDPRYLFHSHTHASALSVLSAASEDMHNIRVLIGEPGVGKTTVLLRLLEQFRHSALTAHLIWTQLGSGEFLHYFLHKLGVFHPSGDVAQGKEQLTRVLEWEFCQGHKVIVAIDEAHDLGISALRELAELLDCNLARSKELEVVLAGFPLLSAKLSAPELQGMWTRIAGIASLSPLTHEECASYVNRRLEVSGYRGDAPFTSDAMSTIATLAEGIPRNINNLCFAALYLAEMRACSVINSAIVLEAAARSECGLDTQQPAQELIEIPTGIATAQQAGPDQQTSRPAEQHISAPGVTSPASAGDASGKASADQSVFGDQGVSATLDAIPRWFGNNRVAWSGTVGELAAVLDRPEIEVVHALKASSDVLRSVGIAVSVRETFEQAPSVSFRRIEEGIKTGAEEAESRPSQAECIVDALDEFDANSWSAKDSIGQNQPADEMIGTEKTPAIVPSLSPADQALDLLRACSLQPIVQRRRYGLRWAVPGLVIALLIVLGWTYSPVLKRKAYVLRSSREWPAGQPLVRQFIKAETASKTILSVITKRMAFAGHAKTFPSRGQESAHVATVPRAPGSRALEGSGVRPDAGEDTQSFQEAARSGDPNAQFQLGTAYAFGRGVAADNVTAYTWLTLAFANGDQGAETLIRQLTGKLNQAEIARIRWNLGEMYAKGIGVRHDKVTAYMWHLLAESAGESRSSTARFQLSYTMTDEEKSEAEARASQWLRRHHQKFSKHSRQRDSET